MKLLQQLLTVCVTSEPCSFPLAFSFLFEEPASVSHPFRGTSICRANAFQT